MIRLPHILGCWCSPKVNNIHTNMAQRALSWSLALLTLIIGPLPKFNLDPILRKVIFTISASIYKYNEQKSRFWGHAQIHTNNCCKYYKRPRCQRIEINSHKQNKQYKTILVLDRFHEKSKLFFSFFHLKVGQVFFVTIFWQRHKIYIILPNA